MQQASGELQRSETTALSSMESRIHGVIHARQNGETERTHQQRERIEPSDHAGSQKRRNQGGNQDVILGPLPGFVAVRRDELFTPLGLGLEAAEEVVQGAQGADPATKEAAEEQCGNQDQQAPKQALI